MKSLHTDIVLAIVEAQLYPFSLTLSNTSKFSNSKITSIFNQGLDTMEQHKHNGMHFELQVHISLFQYTPRSRCCPWKARVLIEADFKVHEQICTVDMRQRSVQQRWGPRMNS